MLFRQALLIATVFIAATFSLPVKAKVCQKPDGKYYGIKDTSKCAAPDKEVTKRPDTGFMNSQAGRALNYDTAKQQGFNKTQDEVEAKAADAAKAAQARAALEEAQKKEKAAAVAKAKAEAEKKEAAANEKAVKQGIADIPNLVKDMKDHINYMVAGSLADGRDAVDSTLEMMMDELIRGINDRPYGNALSYSQKSALSQDVLRSIGYPSPRDKMAYYSDQRESLKDGYYDGKHHY